MVRIAVSLLLSASLAAVAAPCAATGGCCAQGQGDAKSVRLSIGGLTADLGGYLRFMYSYDDAADPGDAVANSYFSVRNARPRVTVRHGDFIRAELLLEGAGSTKLLDAFAEWTPSAWFGIRVGQYKVPFGREMLRSTTDLIVYDRGRSCDQLSQWRYLNRDVGATAILRPAACGRPTVSVGVFNGAGANAPDADDYKDFVVRGLLSPLPLLEVGANYRAKKVGYPGAADSSDTYSAFGVDFLLKRCRFEMEGEMLQAEAPGSFEATARGIMLTARYKGNLESPLLSAWEIAAKVEVWDPDIDTADDGLRYVVFGPAAYLRETGRLQLNVELQSSQQDGVDGVTRVVAMLTVPLS